MTAAVRRDLPRIVQRRGEQLAGLMIAECRRLAFAALSPRLTPLTRLCVTALRSQRYSNSEASRCRVALPQDCGAQDHRTSDDVSTRHCPKLVRPTDASKLHEIAHCVFVSTARVLVADVGEPLDVGRHVGQAVEFGGRQ
jgi:hypothetical protein